MNPRRANPLSRLFSNADIAQEDSGMLSYVDVFVLMATVFVLALLLNRPNLAPQAGHDTPTLIEQIANLPAPAAGTKLTTPKPTGWLAAFQRTLNEEHLENLVTLHEQPEVTELSIATRVLFNAGEAELTRAGQAVLGELLPAIAKTSGMVYIEGHTDDLPFFDDKFPTNWELAAARANAVLTFFVAGGVDEKHFRAVSFGDTQPLVPNTSESNRQKNRRVTLVIHRHIKD